MKLKKHFCYLVPMLYLLLVFSSSSEHEGPGGSSAHVLHHAHAAATPDCDYGGLWMQVSTVGVCRRHGEKFFEGKATEEMISQTKINHRRFLSLVRFKLMWNHWIHSQRSKLIRFVKYCKRKVYHRRFVLLYQKIKTDKLVGNGTLRQIRFQNSFILEIWKAFENGKFAQWATYFKCYRDRSTSFPQKKKLLRFST